MSYNSLIDSVFPSKKSNTPQNIPLPGQIENNANGYYYPIDEWKILDRFLILGTESGTYYVDSVKLTKDNTTVLQKLLKKDPNRVINQIIKISLDGRSPKNDSAIFALAIASSSDDLDTRKIALAALSKVCRTGTHLLMFCDLVNKMRGWGASLRKGINRWFENIPADKLALQTIKYYNRHNWTLRDILRKTHLKLKDSKEKALLIDWIVHPNKVESISSAARNFPLIEGKYKVLDILNNKNDKYLNDITNVIKQYSLPREAIPNELFSNKEIWDALLADMPITAMIRNLGKMSQVGLLVPFSDSAKYVANTLLNREILKKGRIHPLQILLALRTYAQGKGEKGSLTWTPVNTIIEALGEAFDLAFDSLEPIGKRMLVAVDISASMNQPCIGSQVLTSIEAAAAIATIFVRTDKETHTIGFNSFEDNGIGLGFSSLEDGGVYEMGLTSKHRLGEITSCFKKISKGGTDLSLPLKYLLEKNLEVDACIIVTDNETWAGDSHTVQALHKYRSKINPALKLVVLSTAANNGSIIDSNDPLSLDIAGFDTNVHYLVSEFIKGNI